MKTICKALLPVLVLLGQGCISFRPFGLRHLNRDVKKEYYADATLKNKTISRSWELSRCCDCGYVSVTKTSDYHPNGRLRKKTYRKEHYYWTKVLCEWEKEWDENGKCIKKDN